MITINCQSLDMVGVTGSIPVAPTTKSTRYESTLSRLARWRLGFALLLASLAGCMVPPEMPAPTPDPAPAPQSPMAPTGLTDAIVFIGDSVTFLWGELPRGAINAGISGQPSITMAQRFQADVLDRRPSIVHILAGTNDIRIFESSDVAHIADMASRAASTGACVIVSTIQPIINAEIGFDPPKDLASFQMIERTLNANIRTLAASSGYLLADYNPLFIGPDGSVDLSLYQDPIHPGPAGYAKMAALVEPLIDQCRQRLGAKP